MTKRIFRSTFIACIVVLAASLGVILGCLYNYFGSEQKLQLADQLEVAAAGVEADGENFLEGIGDTDTRITWIDSDGSVIFDSVADSQTMENHLEREEVQEAIETGEGQSSRWSATLVEKEIYYAKLLDDGTVLRVSVKRMTPQALIMGMLQPILIVLVVALILAAVLAQCVSKRIARPLNTINLDDPLSNDSYEELRPLLERIAKQQVEIGEQMNAIKSVSEMRREFTANVSHELKTPLQSIMGSAEILENGLVREADRPEFISRIRKESERLLSLIDDIVRLSKLDGQMDVTPEDVSLLDVARDVYSSLLSVARKKNVNIEVLGDDVHVESFRPLVTEIVFNLADNAIKYNKDGGSVKIKVLGPRYMGGSGVAAGGARIVVEDTGIGIAPEEQQKVFERFYRVEKSHSRNTAGGTGLGLSIVKHAAEQIGAKIDIDSTVGEGTKMTVEF